MAINYILQALIFPPASLILLCLIGLLLISRHPRLGKNLIALSLGLTILFSSKPIAHSLHESLARYGPIDLTQLQSRHPQALVIMGGGARRHALEFAGGDTVSRYTLERIRYGAILARETELPVLVTGGRVMTSEDRPSEAELMAGVLTEELHVPVRWMETESRNSFENAKLSYEMLKPEGIERIVLVTHGFHMMRSVEAFEHVGFEVIPAPTVIPRSGPNPGTPGILDWIPTSGNMQASVMGLHEWLGMLWYWIRYY